MSALAALARRAIGFVNARPGLDFFLRRQVARHPALANLLRRTVARSRQQGWQLSAAPAYADDAQLPDSAQQVLRDLRQAQVAAQARNPAA